MPYRSMTYLIVAVSLMTCSTLSNAQSSPQGRVIDSANEFTVLPHEQRVEPINQSTHHRLDNLLPQLMDKAGLDMWLVINREYAEDPVYFSLVPQPAFAARRTTMLIFNRLADGSVEKLSVNTYPFGKPYKSVWSGGNLNEQWQALADLIVTKDPQRIGINVSRDWPVHANTAYAIEGNVKYSVPEWQQKVQIMLEQTALFDGQQVIYSAGRQTQWHLIN